MAYIFKKFENRNIKQENRITITRSYSMGLPRKFYQDNGVKDFKYAVLYYDEANKAIGVHFTNEKDKNGFSVIHSPEYGGQIVIRSFLKTYNIDPEIYHNRYEWEKYNLEGTGEIFVIKLKERDKK